MDGVLKTLTAENAKKFAEYAEKRQIKEEDQLPRSFMLGNLDCLFASLRRGIRNRNLCYYLQVAVAAFPDLFPHPSRHDDAAMRSATGRLFGIAVEQEAVAAESWRVDGRL